MLVAFYVALPFIWNDEGNLVRRRSSGPVERLGRESLARRMADIAVGAVAFSRTSESTTGEFEDAVILRTFGEVPSKDQILGKD